MKKLFSISIVLLAAFVGVASAQVASVEGVNSAIQFNTPNLYVVSTTAFRVSAEWYTGNQPLAYGEISSLSAVTNNAYTYVQIKGTPGTDMARVSARVYLDVDGDARTGSGVGFYPGQESINDFGFDYVVHVGWYGASLNRQGQDCCIQGVELVDKSTSQLTVRIDNRVFGADDRPRMRMQVTLLDNGSGYSLSVAPANGVVTIPTTTIVILSPATGTKLYKIGGEETVFSLIAEISTIVPDSQATIYVDINGTNFSEVFRVNAVTGYKTSNTGRVGGPNHTVVTKRFVYPIGTIIQSGGTARVSFTVITPEGAATDTVQYTAEQIIER